MIWVELPMPELLWLDGYCGQTVEELIALESKYRIESLVLAFECALGKKAARLGRESLSDEESIILAVEALEREVNNGGYDQYFFNTPEYAPMIVRALQRIGCPKTAEITQNALIILQEMSITAEEFRPRILDVTDECE
jgi:hypothetical protein